MHREALIQAQPNRTLNIVLPEHLIIIDLLQGIFEEHFGLSVRLRGGKYHARSGNM
jgi:hypothetical protein